ncbi:helix-turn-helix transcriptional regulator [Zhongshania aquimaris]|uniref:LuxR C-terminal-related transcriptional regulator n=1 Tax=Zhongshania aquimaris TaxID=2857107 RepID=A0ABS6VTG6_9GAMM|nr:LuxR C-terminal-related transcriptional regulator [Zhongshania aquimaris]MBW2941333.1 LuxR C-terminal-related transcriptional regulator [Zhongshania aquimaris]
MTLLKIGRGRGLNHFSDLEKDLISVLVRHIRQFMRLCNHIEHLEIERNICHDVIDKFSLASIVLDQRGLVVHINGSAEKLLRITPELCIDTGRVVIDDFAAQEKFEGIIARMLAARHSDAPCQSETMRISRDGHSLDMGLAIRPLAGARDISPGAPAIAVFIRDAGLCSSAPITVVSELFALSPTESRVAVLLADGLSLVEITEFLGMAHATVRTHLRSVFKKMGVDRQALVVRLIITSVANLA